MPEPGFAATVLPIVRYRRPDITDAEALASVDRIHAIVTQFYADRPDAIEAFLGREEAKRRYRTNRRRADHG